MLYLSQFQKHMHDFEFLSSFLIICNFHTYEWLQGRPFWKTERTIQKASVFGGRTEYKKCEFTTTHTVRTESTVNFTTDKTENQCYECKEFGLYERPDRHWFYELPIFFL